MEKLTKNELLDEAIELMTRLKSPLPGTELNLEVRRFRNKLKQAEIMPDWQVDECVARLHDFLLDFNDLQ
jgi:hypothetical protein